MYRLALRHDRLEKEETRVSTVCNMLFSLLLVHQQTVLIGNIQKMNAACAIQKYIARLFFSTHCCCRSFCLLLVLYLWVAELSFTRCWVAPLPAQKSRWFFVRRKSNRWGCRRTTTPPFLMVAHCARVALPWQYHSPTYSFVAAPLAAAPATCVSPRLVLRNVHLISVI